MQQTEQASAHPQSPPWTQNANLGNLVLKEGKETLIVFEELVSLSDKPGTCKHS